MLPESSREVRCAKRPPTFDHFSPHAHDRSNSRARAATFADVPDTAYLPTYVLATFADVPDAAYLPTYVLAN